MLLRHRLLYVFLLIAIVVAPSAFSLVMYHVTKNPLFRPLGVTERALRDFGIHMDGLEIVALVDWAPAPGATLTREQLTKALRDSFVAKGVDVHVRFEPGRSYTQVSYLVGSSKIGPFPLSEAARGVTAAVEAYRMH